MSGKPVAQILVDSKGRLFSFKTIDASKHMLKQPPAFAYDTFIIDQAEEHGVLYHVIHDRSTKRTWSTWHTTVQLHGFTFNRGFGEQTALTLPFWNEGAEPIETKVIEIHAPAQFDLFQTDEDKAA